MALGGYVVREIRLENIMSYERLHLKMGPGSLGIVGNNGAGKSTLLESLYAALTAGGTLRFPGTRGANALLRRGAGSGYIEVTLEDASGSVLVARVNLRRMKGSDYILKKKQTGNGQMRLLASRQEDYARALMEELGLSLPGKGGLRDFLSRAVIVPQGGLRQIAESMERPERLREEIETAIGLPEYRKAVERLERQTLTVEEEGERVALRIGPRVLATVQHNLRETKDRIQQLEGKLNDLRRKEENLKNKLGEARRAVEELEKRREEAALELRELELLEKMRLQAKRQLEDVERKLEEAQGRLQEAEKAREELRGLGRLKELYEQLPAYDAGKQELLKKTHEAKEVEELLNKIRRWQELAEAEERARELAVSLEERQRQLEEARSQLNQAQALQTRALEESRRLEKEVHSIRVELARLAETLLGASARAPEEVPALIRKVLEEHRRSHGELERRMSELEALRRLRENSLKALRDARGDKCPLCGSPLDSAHREQVQRLLESELRRLEEELAGLRSFWQESSEKLKQMENALDKASRLWDELVEKTRRLRELEGELQNLGGQVEEWSGKVHSLEREVEELRRTLNELQGLVGERNALARELAKKGITEPGRALAELESQLSTLKDEVGRLRSSTRAFEERLLNETGLQSLGDALQRLRALGEMLGRLTTLAEEIPRLRELVRELEEKRRELAGQVSELEKKLAVKAHVKEKLEKVEGELARARGELEALEGQRLEVANQVSSVEALLRENLKKARLLEKQESLLKAGLAVRGALEELVRSLYRRSLRRLEAEMSRILDTFDLEPTRVEIVEEDGAPHLLVYTRGQEKAQVSELSGGEKTAVALAYVIALNTIMGARIGFLALDEPTSELDEDRRKVLVQVLSQLASPRGGVAPPLSQLLVVTHHTEVMDSVDTVCTVVKEEGRSRVQCTQPL